MSIHKLLRDIAYIFEDEDIIVVSKPSGLLSAADRYKETINLKDVLLKKCDSIYTIHHLDKETSGILVFAKNEKTHSFLSKQFASQEVENIFWAFVQNTPEIDSGIIEVPLLNDMRKSGKMHISKDGKPAITKFKILENYNKISLLAFLPLTKRTHQIRVHSKYLGCPLLVDGLYTRKNNFYLSEIKRNYKISDFENEKPFIKRLTLHSKSLSFTHPNGEKMFFESELPKDLRALKKQLDKLLK